MTEGGKKEKQSAESNLDNNTHERGGLCLKLYQTEKIV